jgi:trimeric autotransporter adhesin
LQFCPGTFDPDPSEYFLSSVRSLLSVASDSRAPTAILNYNKEIPMYRKTNRRLTAGLVPALILFACSASSLWAQSSLGGLRGTISDAQNAAIAEVKVSLTNNGTGETRAVLTNASGGYDFTALQPATYSIVAEHPGFKKFERKNIVVGTQEFPTIDVVLEVGSITESILVTEEVALVEASNASQGQVLDNQKLTELPNLGRNPFMLSKLAANVIPVGNPAYNRMEDQSGSSSISIAGGPVRGNNYLLDGVPITDATNRAIIIPSLEAVQEVKVQANTYDAEMARTGGGMFNTLMKSGGNSFHGSAYGHLRQTSWDANNFFNNAAGIPISDQPNYTWGASFGGPVWIPKIYNGKNKTFFWLAEEHYDDTQSNSGVFSTPTLLERKGDFSQSSVTIYDPLAALQANGSRTPFAGNIIPTSRINPVGFNMAATYVLPQTTATKYGGSNLAASTRLPARANQMTARLDEQFTSWWHTSLSYLRYFSLEPGDTFFGNISAPSQWRLQRRVDTTQLNNSFTINPTTVATVRYGFNRFPNYDYQASQGFNLSTLGFAPSFVAQVNPSKSQFPYVAMTNMYSLGDNDDNSFYVHASNNFSASLDHYKGRHALKVGFDYRRIKAAGNDSNNAAGNYAFNGIFTRSLNTSAGTGGADMADLLLGYPSSGAIYTSTKLTDYADYYGLFIQDNFRLNSKITLNYGLRWERELGLQEQNNGLVVNFLRDTTNPIAANVTGILPKGVVQYAGVNGAPTSVGNPYANKWGPRIGIAYQLNDKTVIRGGYGIFWAPQFAIGSPLATPGYNATTSYIASTNGNLTPTGSLTDPFPAGITQPTGNSLGQLTGIGQSISLFSPYGKSPEVQQYSLDIQRELPFGIALELGYVGSHSTHLSLGAATYNTNALNPSLLSMGSALNVAVPNPYYQHGGSGVVGTATVPQSQLLLPFSAFGAVNLQFDGYNHARYDSLIVKAQKRLSHGLTFLSTLTWSRNNDASSGGAGNGTLNAGGGGPQNPYDLAAEYSRSNFDTPLRFATSFSYELPFGRGKAFANGGSKWVDYLVGGWQTNAVATFQTGFPLQVTQSTNFNSGYGYAVQRPNATGADPSTSGSLEDRLGGYFNPAAFSQAPQYTFGNLSRTLTIRGPGQANWDASLFKSVTIKEVLKCQFRFEALNAMNTPLFAAPNTSFGSSSFGKITSQVNFSRQLQLALRFSF